MYSPAFEDELRRKNERNSKLLRAIEEMKICFDQMGHDLKNRKIETKNSSLLVPAEKMTLRSSSKSNDTPINRLASKSRANAVQIVLLTPSSKLNHMPVSYASKSPAKPSRIALRSSSRSKPKPMEAKMILRSSR